MKFNLSFALASWILLQPALARLGGEKKAPHRRLQYGNAPYGATYSCDHDNASCMNPQQYPSLGNDQVYMTAENGELTVTIFGQPTGPYNWNLCYENTQVDMILTCTNGGAVSNPQLSQSSHISCSTTTSGNQMNILCTNTDKNNECEFVQINSYTCGTPVFTASPTMSPTPSPTRAPTMAPTSAPTYASSYSYVCNENNVNCMNPAEGALVPGEAYITSSGPFNMNLNPGESVALDMSCSGGGAVSNPIMQTSKNIQCNQQGTGSEVTMTCQNTAGGEMESVQLNEFHCGEVSTPTAAPTSSPSGATAAPTSSLGTYTYLCTEASGIDCINSPYCTASPCEPGFPWDYPITAVNNAPLDFNLSPGTEVTLSLNCMVGVNVHDIKIYHTSNIKCSNQGGGDVQYVTCRNTSGNQLEYVQLNGFECGKMQGNSLQILGGGEIGGITDDMVN